jgi:hypothetical protein
MSFALMGTYEPFGQSSSAYEDTGYPEMTAMGLRAFLSVPENIQMLNVLGQSTINSVETVGCCAEFDKKYNKTGPRGVMSYEAWKELIGDIKAVCDRTYSAIMRGVSEYLVRMAKMPETTKTEPQVAKVAPHPLKCGRPCPKCKGRVKDGKAGICERQDGHGILHRCGRCGKEFVTGAGE